LEYNELTAT